MKSDHSVVSKTPGWWHPACWPGIGPLLAILLLAALLLAGLWPSPAAAAAETARPRPAADASAKPDKAATAPSDAAPGMPQPIAPAHLVSRAERDESLLDMISGRLKARSASQQSSQALRQLNSDYSIARRRSQAVMASGNLRKMRDFEPVWKELQTQAEQLERQLTQMAERLQGDLNQIEQMQKIWESTLAAAETDETPDSIRNRMLSLLAHIQETRRDMDQARAGLFELQTRSSRLQAQVNAERALLKNTLADALDTLFVPDSPQIYGPRTHGGHPGDSSLSGIDRLQGVATTIQIYLKARPVLCTALLLLLFGLYGTLRKIGARAGGRIEEARRLRSVRWLLAAPFSISLLTTVAVASLLLPYPPASLNLLLLLAALLPTIVLLRQMAPPYLAPFLHWLLVMYVLNQLPNVLQPGPTEERLLFQGQMIATLLALVFLQIRRKRAVANALAQAAAEQPPASTDCTQNCTDERPLTDYRRRSLSLTGHAISAVLLGCVLALLADLAGFTRLGRFASQATLNALFGGMILFTGALVAISLLRLAMRLRPLNMLNMVAHDGALIEARLARLIRWVAALLWVAMALDQLMILSLVLDWLFSVLDATLNIGQISISLADLLRFGLILWGSLLLSRLLRYVLDQEVFSRISLPRGIPYACTTVLNYLLLIGGLLLAVAATGISLDRFTIFASALGVGVGFGLQSIVNNFVSGLIVLFARPIKVGDSVDLSGQSGTVQRIGIRASVLRTAAGADVVVPNSQLISNQVVNWTLTEPQRRIEITLSVSYDSDPERVLSLLADIANSHDHILAAPAPNAQFSDFGAKGLQFKLFAWTADVERLNAIRSELCIQIHQALRREKILLMPPA